MREKLSFILVAVVLALSVWVGLCRAEGIGDIIAKLPVTNAGVYYNLNEKNLEFTSTFKAIGYSGFNLNIGYASSESLVGNISYEILKLEKLGIELPILKEIIVDAGWTAGWRRAFDSQAEFSSGPSITLKWSW